MGTYLSLKLRDKTFSGIIHANSLWNKENSGFENTLHFTTEEDIEKDIEWIHSNPEQKHLRYIKTVRDWNKAFPMWGTGTFQVKITLGDYLCSEMAERYLNFLQRHKKLFVEYPDDYVIEILEQEAAYEHKAKECLVDCPYCKQKDKQQ